MRRIKRALMLVLFSIIASSTVYAAVIDTNRTGTIIINSIAQKNNNPDSSEPLKGVEYTIYRVGDVGSESISTVEQAESYIGTNVNSVDKKTTDSSGIVTFSDLTLGRYYVKVTGVPNGTSRHPESFLVDVPMTNETGTEWDYEVEVSPKIQIALGNAIITKRDLSGSPMRNVKFKVQVSTEEGVWSDYVPEGQKQALELTTDDQGQIKLENYPIQIDEKVATFRFYEVETQNGYIINNKNLDKIRVNEYGKTIVIHANGNQEEPVDIGNIQITDQKPGVVKKVKNNLDVASASLTDSIPFIITVDVPTFVEDMTTFKVTDTLPSGLKNRKNVEIKGLSSSGEEDIIDAFEETEAGKELIIDFDTSKLKDYTSIIIRYNVSLDMDNVVLGSVGNVNTTEFEYTDNIDIDGSQVSSTTTADTAKVVTGGIKISKVDTQQTQLSGAKFKVATSEDDARSGNFVKGVDGNDIEVTTVTGDATINGLAYNDDQSEKEYWLVETQAPTFTDDGEQTPYSLLTAPVRVAVGGTSQDVAIKVINRKPLNLPLTGGMGVILFIIVGVTLLLIARSINREKKEE